MADSEVLQVHVKPPVHEEARAPSKGFVVRDAPWTASSSEKVGGFLQGTPPHAQRPGEGAARGRPSAARVLPPADPVPFLPQAPDMSSSEEFPSFGAQVAPKTLPWGPKR